MKIKWMILISFVFAVLAFTNCDPDEGGDDPEDDPSLSGNITISPSGTVVVSTQLTATYTGTESVSYRWKRDSTNNVGTNSRYYTPDQAGEYTVTVSAAGFTGKTSAAVTVTPVSVPQLPGDITITPTGTVYVNAALIAEYTGTETVSYQWKRTSYPEANVGTGLTTYTPNISGSYTVTVSAQGFQSKTSAEKTVLPIPDLPGNVTVSPNGRVIKNTPLTANYTGPQVVSWQWEEAVPDGFLGFTYENISGAVGVTYTPNQAGSYRAKAVYDGYNDKPSDAVSVYESVNPPEDSRSLAEKLAWFENVNNVQAGHTYTLNVGANETIAPQTISYFTLHDDVTIILKGSGAERVVSLNGNGPLFTLSYHVILKLDENITLKGHSGNNDSLVRVTGGGKLVMEQGSKITGNTAPDGGGVYLYGGTFTMNGGTISDNTATNYGGGVYIYGGTGIFTMTGGTISGNTAKRGGGVYVQNRFVMSAGTITGNTASEYGGGVYVQMNALLDKTGGTVSGYNAGSSNNTVKDGSGVLNNRGHAIYGDYTMIIKLRYEGTSSGSLYIHLSDSNGWEYVDNL